MQEEEKKENDVTYEFAAAIAKEIAQTTNVMEFANSVGAGLNSKGNGTVYLCFETEADKEACPIKDEYKGVKIVSKVYGPIFALSKLIPAGCVW